MYIYIRIYITIYTYSRNLHLQRRRVAHVWCFQATKNEADCNRKKTYVLASQIGYKVEVPRVNTYSIFTLLNTYSIFTLLNTCIYIYIYMYIYMYLAQDKRPVVCCLGPTYKNIVLHYKGASTPSARIFAAALTTCCWPSRSMVKDMQENT